MQSQITWIARWRRSARHGAPHHAFGRLERRVSLSGRRLSRDGFSAQIEERDGLFVGQIQEPNLKAPSLPSVFTAEIEGIRAGLHVSFTKFYGAQVGFHMAIRYEGDANDALTRVDGVWTRPDWSGTFFMTRDEDGEAVGTEESVEAEVGSRQ